MPLRRYPRKALMLRQSADHYFVKECPSRSCTGGKWREIRATFQVVTSAVHDRDLNHRVIRRVGYEQDADAVEGEPVRAEGRDAVGQQEWARQPRGRDASRGSGLPDDPLERVRDVDVAGLVEGERVQHRVGCERGYREGRRRSRPWIDPKHLLAAGIDHQELVGDRVEIEP